ncbi:MAG TPA: hypothetical protein PL009_13545 [Flavipsychrobacter sp.]|nr:hypothetical protein [Flavipsychrobacter sp.]
MILKFLENPFDTDKLSREDFNELSQNHLTYLINANAGEIYSPIIAIVTPKASAYNAWFNTLESTDSVGTSKTILLNEKLDEIEDKIEDIHAEVSFKFKKNNPALFEEFFPNGLTPFKRMRRAQVEAMVTSLLTVCNEHIELLEEAKVNELDALLTAYIALDDDQKDAKQNVKDSSHDGGHLRTELATALFQALIKLLDLHFADMDVIKTLYDAKYLNLYIEPAPEPEPVPEP